MAEPSARRLGAFDALAAMLSLGSVGYQSEVNERGERLVWLAPPWSTGSRPWAGRARPIARSSCGWSG